MTHDVGYFLKAVFADDDAGVSAEGIEGNYPEYPQV